MIDRSDAVRIAMLDRDCPSLTPTGIRTLAKAVLAMDAYIQEADAAAKRWYEAASPYATPEALREALGGKAETKPGFVKCKCGAWTDTTHLWRCMYCSRAVAAP